MVKIINGFFDCRWAERDGKVFAEMIGGAWRLIREPIDGVMKISRAQAFKLWDRHFQGRACYCLPFFIEAATEANVAAVYFTRNKIVYIEMED